MLEIEAKLKVDSLDPVRERLETRGARFIRRVLERNTVYDRADGSLRASGCGLRVRRCETLAGESVGDTVTFKGPVRKGPYKTREEVEVHVDSAETAHRLLAALGCVEVMEFQKRRELWKLGECEVALDELVYLGTFVEIEGPDEAAVRRVQDRLDLGAEPHVAPGYISLLVEYCDRRGLDSRRIVFPSEMP